MPDMPETDGAPRRRVTLTVNGERVAREIPVRLSLADFLRAELGLTGTHLGCEHGVCGACTLFLDGVTVRSCLTLAVQADGAEVVTIEGLSRSGRAAALQQAFQERNAAQCGFCTPGMLASAVDYIESGGSADRTRIREAISGNYCRCTGYMAIVEAVEDAIAARV